MDQQKRCVDDECCQRTGQNLEAYCCGSDGNIFNINQGNEPYEAGAIMSQLCMTHNAKALFAGVGQTNKPGAI